MVREVVLRTSWDTPLPILPRRLAKSDPAWAPEEDVIPPSQYGGQTIAPNALASGTPMRDSFQQPSFTELVMNRPGSSSSALFPSPRRMPSQHLPRMQQLPHDHMQQHPHHYQSAIPRQFESRHQPFAAGLQSMNNVFDRGFHLGDGAATESDGRNGSDYSSYGAAGYVNPLPRNLGPFLYNVVSEDVLTLSLTLPPTGDRVYVDLCDTQSTMAQSGRPTDLDLKEFAFLAGANNTNGSGPSLPTNANQDSAAAAMMNRCPSSLDGEMPRGDVEMGDDDLDNVVSENAGLSTLPVTLPLVGDCVYVGFRHTQSTMVESGWPTDLGMENELPDQVERSWVASPKWSWVASLKRSWIASLKWLTSSAGANNTDEPGPPPPRSNVNQNSAGVATMNRRLSSPRAPPSPSSTASKLSMFGSPKHFEFAAPPKSNAMPGISEAALLTLDETRVSGSHVIPLSLSDVCGGLGGRSIDSLRGNEAAEIGSKLHSVRS